VNDINSYADLAKIAYELGKKEKWSSKKTMQMLQNPAGLAKMIETVILY
jgi:hypothetical protein